MATFMAVHEAPELSWEEVEKKWMELSKEQAAIWVRTWFNKERGIRYCEWMAPNAKLLEEIFSRHGVTWESVLEVEKTSPGAWRWSVSPLAADEPLDAE